MIKSIKRYELNNNVDVNKLLEVGFKKGRLQDSIDEPKISYNCILDGNIELCIEIYILENNKLEFDDLNNVLVLDDKIEQTYQDNPVAFLEKIINIYNQKMDYFVEIGIFNKIIKNKTYIKK